MPNAPRRLDVIFQKYDPPVFFVTFNTHRRRPLLANSQVHQAFIDFANAGASQGLAIGRYVIMPDHVHLFACGRQDYLLSQWIRLLKRKLSESISGPPPHWQRGFFDRLIRHGESYAEKWEYVRQNPTRAALVADPDEWPFKGELTRIEV